MNTYNRCALVLWLGVMLTLLNRTVSPALDASPTPSPVPALDGQALSSKPLYGEPMKLGEGREWRPYPLVVDLNRDGKLDIVATHRRPLHENALHIWLGDGQRGFRPVEQTWATPGYAGLAVGDINGDGHLDLLAASHFSRLHTLLGGDAMTFTDRVVSTPEGYTSAKLADLNGDGHLDAVLLHWKKRGLEIYAGDGTGAWGLKARLMEGSVGRDLALADVNEDGKIDIVGITANHRVQIFWQKGISDWTAKDTDFVSATSEFRSVALGDVNRDGHLDIALNGGYQGLFEANGPDFYFGDGNGNWTPASQGLKALNTPPGWGIALGDVNRDGHLDIVAGGVSSNAADEVPYGLYLFTGDSKGNWTLDANSGLPSTGLLQPYSIQLADLNQDDCLDIVVAHGGSEGPGGYLTIWSHQ